MSIISQHNNSVKFNSDGWPLNPATGQPYTRDEIITNPAIPYPQDVDTNHPYWRRRTSEELTAQKAKLAKKSKPRRTRSRRRTLTHTIPALTQQDSRTQATAALVTRANEDPQSLEFLIHDGVHPYNDPEDEFHFVVIVDGDEIAWTETKSQAERSYDELTTPDPEPRSILVTCGSQLSILEM